MDFTAADKLMAELEQRRHTPLEVSPSLPPVAGP